MTIGLDMGYGYTKAVTASDSIIFPSVMGQAGNINFRAEEITSKYPGMTLLDKADRLWLGDLALSQLRTTQLRRLRARATTGDNEIANDFRRRLMLAAIGLLGARANVEETLHVQIATGLPVDHMLDAIDLKTNLIGTHLIKTDSAAFIANVTDVFVMPQPYGSMYAESLTPTGAINKHYTYTRTGVCDIGTYTLDIAVDDDMEYIASESGSLEAGLYLAHEYIAEAINARHRERPSQRVVEDVIKHGYFSAFGEREDMRAEVEQALKPLREAVVTLANDRWGRGMNLEVIYLTGGGAPLVASAMRAIYRHAHVLENPVFANARGYLQFALFKAQS
jgi:plasmid segregation protein ParM